MTPKVKRGKLIVKRGFSPWLAGSKAEWYTAGRQCRREAFHCGKRAKATRGHDNSFCPLYLMQAT